MRFRELVSELIVTAPKAASRARGATFVEAAIVTPCFLVLIFTCIQFMFISFRALSLQWITTEVMRDVVLGKCGNDQQQSCQTGQVYTFAKQHFQTLARPLGIDPSGTPNSFCLGVVSSSQTGTCGENSGESGDLVELRTTNQVPLFFSRLFFINFGAITIQGSALGVIESAPQRN